MADAPAAARPRLYTIPAHRAFADALVGGLMRGRDVAQLARGMILLPNNRAVRAVTEAFVRASGGGLLLPRLVPLGDPDLGEAVGAALDTADEDDPPPPAVAPYARRMILARLVGEERARAGQPVPAAEAVRLAGDLAHTLDQLLVEEVPPTRLAELDLGPELTEHWHRALSTFRIVLDRWPDELARLGRIDAADRRARLLGRLETRWRLAPPPGFVCAAGITDAAPAVARLLRCVSEMAEGQVVFAGLDLDMAEEEWEALGPHPADPVTGHVPRSIETHPQFHLKQMLDRMGVARGEVRAWRGGAAAVSGPDSDPARGRAIANALAPAEFTGRWTNLAAADRRLSGVRAIELPTPADEAQAIALTLRQALEETGRTAALVTPDRALARRVAVHCRRWGIDVADSAGQPLSLQPPGTLLLALAEAAAQRFAPLALLALLKHPLVRADNRLHWLDGVRALDRALRGPRPPAGLDGLAPEGTAAEFWAEARPVLEPVGHTFDSGAQPLAGFIACLREAAQTLCGDALWSGPAGRAAADFIADLEAEAGAGPALVEPTEMPALLRTLLDEVPVRIPPGLGHPRLAIYGLIEARLQTADLMVLGGLNEGVWPGRPAPDPWLAPRIRTALGLSGLERRIGVAAHDFAQGLGAPQVLITRARRDASAPALASRLWLRLQAMAGDRFVRDHVLEGWTRALDDAGIPVPAERPHPSPPVAQRPKSISVTEVDRLKADPYAFYARRVLRLMPLDPVDADPTAAWRGTAVHAILEAWWKEDRCAPHALRPRAMTMLEEAEVHPLLRALWQPRLREAIDWIAAEVEAMAGQGRRVLAAEGKGAIDIAGVRLSGRFDRIDRLADGIGIIDYKTGKPPSAAAVRNGFSLQLGLLGLIAERGGFEGVEGRATAFEYWSLAKKRDAFGFIESPCDPAGKRDRIVTDEFVAIAAANFTDVAGEWLTGDAPFTAKLVPEYAPYAEYDQLMRRDEWYGRDR
ncbi:double-strand break repair protein AddB [Sphingomonas sp. S-NIH.Pt15_0812]|uniref:double-strand break repair protein AddB n=1 Tax=Sphingomonas sp. S-NIH.Pt15_0812 TaxID=1920129 RepID=UPI000F7E375C|nr:double-strand break repair protein AddB [Sphingomonas sp. S-NIH.Pt15_0812]RSU52355.1 double-strand break repair protein AddB [Sphingomonas sp. S-NIH.Pt15_0812]